MRDDGREARATAREPLPSLSPLLLTSNDLGQTGGSGSSESTCSRVGTRAPSAGAASSASSRTTGARIIVMVVGVALLAKTIVASLGLGDAKRACV
jgi:hypothetical protein